MTSSPQSLSQAKLRPYLNCNKFDHQLILMIKNKLKPKELEANTSEQLKLDNGQHAALYIALRVNSKQS